MQVAGLSCVLVCLGWDTCSTDPSFPCREVPASTFHPPLGFKGGERAPAGHRRPMLKRPLGVGKPCTRCAYCLYPLLSSPAPVLFWQAKPAFPIPSLPLFLGRLANSFFQSLPPPRPHCASSPVFPGSLSSGKKKFSIAGLGQRQILAQSRRAANPQTRRHSPSQAGRES